MWYMFFIIKPLKQTKQFLVYRRFKISTPIQRAETKAKYSRFKHLLPGLSEVHHSYEAKQSSCMWAIHFSAAFLLSHFSYTDLMIKLFTRWQNKGHFAGNIFEWQKKIHYSKHAVLSKSCAITCIITYGSYWGNLRMEPRGCIAPGHKFNIQTAGRMWICVQLSGSPAVPALIQKPLTPPVAPWMDLVFVVAVEGKDLLLMTLRSPGIRAHEL